MKSVVMVCVGLKQPQKVSSSPGKDRERGMQNSMKTGNETLGLETSTEEDFKFSSFHVLKDRIALMKWSDKILEK